MELRIGNRTTLFAHARLAESAICFEEAIVTFALDDVLPGSIRTGGHGYDGRQASRREGQADRSLKDHDITCDERNSKRPRSRLVPHKLVVKIKGKSLAEWRNALLGIASTAGAGPQITPAWCAALAEITC